MKNTDVFSRSVRSDELPHLAVLLRYFEPFKSQLDFFRFNVILDANIVLKELIWFCKKRKQANARSNIAELIDCHVVKAYAPTFLLVELKTHIPRLAAEQNIDEARMWSYWEQFSRGVELVDVGGPASDVDPSIRDPKDVPYIKLQEQLNALICSEDKDLHAMGAGVVQVNVFGALKAYSRNIAIVYRVKVVGVGAILGGAFLIDTVVKRALLTAKAFKGIHPLILWIGIGLLLLLLLHPRLRGAIGELIALLFDGAENGLLSLGRLAISILDIHNLSQNEAEIALAEASIILENNKVDSDGRAALQAR